MSDTTTPLTTVNGQVTDAAPAPDKPRKPRRSAEEVRRDNLEAALKVMAEEGYEVKKLVAANTTPTAQERVQSLLELNAKVQTQLQELAVAVSQNDGPSNAKVKDILAKLHEMVGA